MFGLELVGCGLVRIKHAQRGWNQTAEVLGDYVSRIADTCLPGERTSPHRHTPAAVRLVLEGSGGGTFVDGMRCEMQTGDFIVTPNWTWHCHENDAATAVTWVDILDVPLVRAANAVFGDMGPVKKYPEVPAGSQA